MIDGSFGVIPAFGFNPQADLSVMIMIYTAFLLVAEGPALIQGQHERAPQHYFLVPYLV